jgi:tetratricopeptide (TPR) repeat protein
MKKHEEEVKPREGLKRAREARGLSQAELAERIGVGDAKTVRRWESGESTPYPYYRQRLADHLGITLEDLEILLANKQEQQTRRRWKIPYQRNPYFIGRDNLFDDLHSAFFSEAGILRQVLVGQPGIGKTQIAIEYAYRYGERYQAILWATAETADTLISDFARIASILQLPERDDPDGQHIVEVVKLWLDSNSGWLLILDNVDDPNLLDGFLPQEGRGHVLLTARDPEVGTRATTITVDKMRRDDGATLLLRRSKIVPEQGQLNDASEHDGEKAREIALEMDGHPLALDQAGAFIAESGCTVHTYFDLYLVDRDRLLRERGRKNFGYPFSLTATILLSFKKIEQVNPVAANVLAMCAFLRPDEIPEAFFTSCGELLEKSLQPVAATPFLLAEAMRELGKYSLVLCRTELEEGFKTVSVHRLVQDVIKDQMSNETQLYWAEHAVSVMIRTLWHLETRDRNRYQCYMSHALVCLEHIDHWKIFREETIYLMTLVGNYLRISGSYAQAKPVCQHAYDLAEEILGQNHDLVVENQNNLAKLFEHLGDYEKAESLYRKAVELCERKSDPTTLVCARVYYDCAYFDKLQGKYSDAEVLARRALTIQEDVLGQEAQEVARTRAILADIYCLQEKFSLAEPLLQRALAISNRMQEANPSGNALVLNSYMLFYYSQKMYPEAAPLCQQVLEVTERECGPEHFEVAKICQIAAEIYRNLGKVTKVEQYCQRTEEIFEKLFGPDSVHVVPTYCTRAATYQSECDYDKSESFYKRALKITAKAFGSDHPDMISVLAGYALLLQQMGRYDEAYEICKRILKV